MYNSKPPPVFFPVYVTQLLRLFFKLKNQCGWPTGSTSGSSPARRPIQRLLTLAGTGQGSGPQSTSGRPPDNRFTGSPWPPRQGDPLSAAEQDKRSTRQSEGCIGTHEHSQNTYKDASRQTPTYLRVVVKQTRPKKALPPSSRMLENYVRSP